MCWRAAQGRHSEVVCPEGSGTVLMATRVMLAVAMACREEHGDGTADEDAA